MLGERNEPEQSRERSLKLEAAGVGAACQWKVSPTGSLTLTPSTRNQIINTVGTSHSYLCKA